MPGAWMIAAGAAILGALAVSEDLAKFLDRGPYVNAGHAVMVGVGLITAGAASVMQMFLMGKHFANLKKAVDANTAGIADVKKAVDANTIAIGAMREDMGKMVAGIERMGDTLEKISGKLDRPGRGGGDDVAGA